MRSFQATLVTTSQRQRHLCVHLILFAFLVLASGAAHSTTIFFEEFADNSAGWTLNTEWQIGPAMVGGATTQGNSDPGLDHTPTANNGIAGVVIGGNASTTVHAFHYLTSPAIDLSGLSLPVDLELWRWLNSDYTPYMQNSIDVFDGAVWQTLWLSGGAPSVFDAAWMQMNFDVTPYANAAFQVRVGFNVNSSGAYTVSSWNVDDIRISTVPEPSTAVALALGLGLLSSRRRASTGSRGV